MSQQQLVQQLEEVKLSLAKKTKHKNTMELTDDILESILFDDVLKKNIISNLQKSWTTTKKKQQPQQPQDDEDYENNENNTTACHLYSSHEQLYSIKINHEEEDNEDDDNTNTTATDTPTNNSTEVDFEEDDDDTKSYTTIIYPHENKNKNNINKTAITLNASEDAETVIHFQLEEGDTNTEENNHALNKPNINHANKDNQDLFEVYFKITIVSKPNSVTVPNTINGNHLQHPPVVGTENEDDDDSKTAIFPSLVEDDDDLAWTSFSQSLSPMKKKNRNKTNARIFLSLSSLYEFLTAKTTENTQFFIKIGELYSTISTTSASNEEEEQPQRATKQTMLEKLSSSLLDDVTVVSNALSSFRNEWEYTIIPNTIQLPNDDDYDNNDNNNKNLPSPDYFLNDDDYESLPVGASMEEIQDVNESIPKLSYLLEKNKNNNNPITVPSLPHDYNKKGTTEKKKSNNSITKKTKKKDHPIPIGSSKQEIHAINVNVHICEKLLENNPTLEDMGDILDIGQREHHLSYEFLSEMYRDAFLRSFSIDK